MIPGSLYTSWSTKIVGKSGWGWSKPYFTIWSRVSRVISLNIRSILLVRVGNPEYPVGLSLN